MLLLPPGAAVATASATAKLVYRHPRPSSVISLSTTHALTDIGAGVAVVRHIPRRGALAGYRHRHRQHLHPRFRPAEVCIAVRAGLEGPLHCLWLAVGQAVKQCCFQFSRGGGRSLAAHLRQKDTAAAMAEWGGRHGQRFCTEMSALSHPITECRQANCEQQADALMLAMSTTAPVTKGTPWCIPAAASPVL